MAFYIPLTDNSFESTEHTAGPWSPDSQHFGPPTALLGRALEALPAAQPSMIARITVEILGPLPLATVHVHADVERPGKSVELLAAELSAEGRVVARARAWRMATSDSGSVRTEDGEPLKAPEEGIPLSRPEGWGGGYLDAMQMRALSGSLAEPGPATVWARQRVALVKGEEPTGLQRLLVLADSGNGVSSLLDPRRWYFINTELTVHLRRQPEGEWIGMDAHTEVGDHGVGTAFTVMHDRRGPLARGAQALLIKPR
ncbi:thioesterase family protein [Actinokineospora xionganensis]|uniref:Thioesterase family protein n=1 Tax=Actinokineospora xionganensis TaxID=2684470 RepID=A0ABR7LDY7_9PSEU|nr:thioesterase family protein [Actinokineospora xionganensis]MBC6450606.1 thioesterase family protein [Actinokineospora xionganensis]